MFVDDKVDARCSGNLCTVVLAPVDVTALLKPEGPSNCRAGIADFGTNEPLWNRSGWLAIRSRAPASQQAMAWYAPEVCV